MINAGRAAARTLAERAFGKQRIQALHLWLLINVGAELAPLDKREMQGKPLFVHIPKTAGTSINSLPVFNVVGHKPWRYYARRLGSDALPPSFTVVRNPYTRLTSAFRYLKNGGGTPLDDWWAKSHLRHYEDVNHFALEALHQRRVKRFMHFRPQHSFVTDSRGHVRVDHLIRFEELEELWPAVAGSLGLPTSLPHKRRSSGSGHVLTDSARKHVFRAYEEDFALFGYSQ